MTMDPINQTLDPPPPPQIPNPNPNPNPNESGDRQWETAAREWLQSLPDGGNAVTVSNVEAWVSLNRTSLPDHITAMPPQDLYNQFASLRTTATDNTQPSPPPPPQALLSTQQKDASQVILRPYQFQRTDLWRPVYTWLESLDTDELIKSQDIIDWLTENPEIREQLSVKHSRYHLMHYIKKCHIKMLKRKEKKKGVQPTSSANRKQIQRTGATKQTVPLIPKKEATKQTVQLPYSFTGNASNNLPKDSDLYAAKHREALKKYEILLELEKQLSVLFPKPQPTREEGTV